MTALEEAAMDLRRKLQRKRRVEEYLCSDDGSPEQVSQRATAYSQAVFELDEALTSFETLCRECAAGSEKRGGL